MLKASIKKWALLLLLSSSSLVIGVRTSIPFFYFVCWFILSTMALCLAWVAAEYFLASPKVERECPRKIDAGERLDLVLTLQNRGILPLLNFIIQDYLPCAPAPDIEKKLLVESLGPGRTLSVNYSIFCPRRGHYRLGPLKLYFIDPLGIFFLRRNCPAYSELFVYPKTFHVRRFPDLSKGAQPWFGIDTSRSAGDEEEFFGVREYKPGDPISRIHWASVAFKNKLIVKQFQRQVFFRATVIFNLRQDQDYGDGEKSVPETIIKLAASVSKYLIDKGVSVEMIAHAQEMVHIPFNKGPEHLDAILKFLSMAQCCSNKKLGEILEEFSKHIPDNSTVIVIMVDKDWEHLPLLLSLEKRNIALIPLVLISSTFKYGLESHAAVKDAKIKLTQAFNFTPLFVSQGQNLEEVFAKC